MKISKALSVVFLFILILAIVIGALLYNRHENPVSIDVAYSPFESTALFLVAQEQGFFSQNALSLTVHYHASGAGALNAVINGEADVAVGTAEFPLTIRALNQESIQTMGTIAKSNFIYLVGRADRGINDVSDLKGKIIGTTFGTIAHYFLGRFLVLNGISIGDVTIVDLETADEWVNAVVDGLVDAVATAQPYANSAQEGLGANAVIWSLNSNQPLYAQVIATKGWMNEYPELSVRFLRSLYQAEEFTINHPAEAKTIVKQQLNFTDEYVETAWGQNQFSLSLDQSLILSMEGEARWLINNNLTNQTMVPNFLDYIYVEGLTSVKPHSVSIIR